MRAETQRVNQAQGQPIVQAPASLFRSLLFTDISKQAWFEVQNFEAYKAQYEGQTLKSKQAQYERQFSNKAKSVQHEGQHSKNLVEYDDQMFKVQSGS